MEITENSVWCANSVPMRKPLYIKFKDMNNKHLANVLKLNRARLEQGEDVCDIICILMKIALKRGLTDTFLNSAYYIFDPDKDYQKFEWYVIKCTLKNSIKKY
jgi:hypothetical protein